MDPFKYQELIPLNKGKIMQMRNKQELWLRIIISYGLEQDIDHWIDLDFPTKNILLILCQNK